MNKTRQLNSGKTFREIYELLGDDKTGNIWVGENYSLKQLKRDMECIFKNKCIELTREGEVWEAFVKEHSQPLGKEFSRVLDENFMDLLIK